MPPPKPWESALARAEQNIASFDAAGLTAAVADLTAAMHAMLADADLSVTELAAARSRLQAFSEHCAYMKSQLNAALVAAATPSHAAVRYAKFRAAARPTQSLMRRTL